MTFDIDWAGNDRGTFSAPLTVSLPLNTPVDVPIMVAPAEAGVHSAHLTLRHDDVVGYAFRMLATIVAPERFTVGNDHTVTRETEVPRPGMQSFFFDVPEGVSALKVAVTWKDREVDVAVVRPDTRYHRAGELDGSGPGKTQVVVEPMPGTWEIRLSDIADTRTFDWEQAKKEEPVPPTPATLTVSALAAEVAVVAEGRGLVADNGDDGDNGTAHNPETHQVWITNRMAGFTGAATSTPVGSARRERRTIAPGEQHLQEVEVLPGSAALMVRTEAPPGTDLDLYLFDCTEEECSAARADGDPVGNEAIVVERPAAGTWKIVVDAADVPEEGAEYAYLDVVFNQAYGMVGTVDVPQERATGARWTATAHSWIAPAVHGEGREPYVAVRVEGQEGDAPFWIGVGEMPEAPGDGR
jgi:hypothetical protein